MLEPLSQDMTTTNNKRKRESADSSPDARKVCFIISHMEKPVAYQIYLIDARDLRCISGSSTSHDDNDWTKQPMQNLTPAIELPSDKYPRSMGFFNAGSRVYMFGGERGSPIAPRNTSEKTRHIERSVYVFDTTASPSPPLSIIPVGRMNGGKFNPLVSHVNGKVYVLSYPRLSIQFNDKTPLFECFDPNSETWSALPNPPFYNDDEYEDFTEYVPNRRRSAVIRSSTVFRSKIFFYTLYEEDFLYAFDTVRSKWETFPMPEYRWQCFPFRDGSVPIPDYDDMWSTAGYPVAAHASFPGHGLISKDIEGLPALLNDHPSLSYSVNSHVLESKEGWFCLLKSGWDAETYAGGKPSLLACLFRLVENRKEKVSACDLYLFPSLHAHDPDCQRSIGEMSVLAAADLRCSLFNIESQHFEEDSALFAAFIL